MPVSFQDGRWSVLSDVIISDEMRAKLQIAADQLKEVSIVTRTQAQQSTSHSLVCFCASVFRLFSRTSKISIENNCGGTWSVLMVGETFALHCPHSFGFIDFSWTFYYKVMFHLCFYFVYTIHRRKILHQGQEKTLHEFTLISEALSVGVVICLFKINKNGLYTFWQSFAY